MDGAPAAPPAPLRGRHDGGRRLESILAQPGKSNNRLIDTHSARVAKTQRGARKRLRDCPYAFGLGRMGIHLTWNKKGARL
ncbi:hypothetical protein EV683_11154 [Crenobacter luteus]|uniref:hypothetical protein n=1 Tax=Crenobacter luteus TaxID=1452487 RepID=UPI00105378AA|nr:hypothetical protein [Crenobacter luteus]TCP11830.1 hypothetical protein EV683_11154 [Crenobacter luteus]